MQIDDKKSVIANIKQFSDVTKRSTRISDDYIDHFRLYHIEKECRLNYSLLIYSYKDFLDYYDQDFVLVAYRAILKREPDGEGLYNNLRLLRSRSGNRARILFNLTNSTEAKKINVKVKGLFLPLLKSYALSIPVLGYLIDLVLCILLLPLIKKNYDEYTRFNMAKITELTNIINENSRISEEKIKFINNKINEMERKN